MLIVGLTGGIGSGKTAVSDLFAEKGITIVDADVVSRIVVEPGTEALKEIEAHFGSEVIQADGQLDRRALRGKVFDDELERKWLEGLLHPLIAQEILRQLQASESAYTILVSPLLLEAGQYKMVDRVLVVDVPRSLQVDRTVNRDDTDAQQVEAIIAAQMQREDRVAKADDVIVNDRDLQHLASEVDRLHETYLKIASGSNQ